MAYPKTRVEEEEEGLLEGKFQTILKQELEEEKLLQGKFSPVQKTRIIQIYPIN